MLRLRVFAGPNGSGKSTIIKNVRKYKVNGRPIDFGAYINADDIAKSLRKNTYDFKPYQITVSKDEFQEITLASGLIGNKDFTENDFLSSYSLDNNKIELLNRDADERLAQIIADFLRKKLLKEERKFSFETVFSHVSKLEIMKEAAKAGYKVYLYFVSTEDPEINKYRVKQVRVSEGGHDVPEDKIVDRYYRSLNLLYDASQIAYQAFFFDNTYSESRLFAQFKNIDGEKTWTLHADKKEFPK